MIRGEGSGEKGTLTPSSDAYAGIADLCIPLVSRKRWPLSFSLSLRPAIVHIAHIPVKWLESRLYGG